jgi:hypothetical protein
LVDGFEVAKKATLEFLESFKTPVVMGYQPDREILKMVARTTLRTKVVALYFSSFFVNKCTHTFSQVPCLTQNSHYLCSCMKDWLIS